MIYIYIYILVQKYINLVKSKPINLGPKGLSKIGLKKIHTNSQNWPNSKPKPV